MAEDIQGVAIPLNNGYVSWVDDADADRIAAHKWYALDASRGSGKPRWYAVTDIAKVKTYMHRFIMRAEVGSIVDHIDNDKMNNRRINLRICPRGHSDNGANRIKQIAPSSSSFKGVSWQRQARKWFARITFEGRTISLGLHESEAGAARAYDAMARELFGAFARTNFGGKS